MEYEISSNGSGGYTVTEKYGSEASGIPGIIFGIIAYVFTLIGMIIATIAVSQIPYALIILIVLDILVISPAIAYPFLRKRGLGISDFFKSIFRFVGRFAYIPFAIMYSVLWILYFNNVTKGVFFTLFFFSMYGMYYFPYFMLKAARKHKSMFMSILTILSI